MSDELSNPSDPSTIDLSLSFGPAWARESDSGERLARLAAKHDREERPERGGGKRREFRDDRSQRQERRPPRREGGDRNRRDGRRDGGKREERRPAREPQGPQPLTGWDVQFLPDKHGVDGLAKQIKNTARAYPLFDLAQLVLEKSERYLVEFKRKSEGSPALFQLRTDGSLWLSEREAVAHALATQLDKFYRRERIAVDPPKGVYLSVAVCGMSGVVLGPSNYHDYQTKLIKLHAERFSSMPFEAFKSRIRMERDEESIAKWKDEQSSKEVFYPIDLSKPSAPEAPAPPAPESETPAPESAEPGVETAEAAVEVVEEIPEAAAEVLAEMPEPQAPEAEAAPSPRFESVAEVELHFRENHAAKAVVEIRQRVIAPGSPAMNSSSPAIHALARGAWEQLRRFPLPMVHTLGQQLAARGVQLFKAHENITYAALARPKYLDRAATPIAEGLSGMLAYIEEHPGVPRPEQWKALVALRPAPPEGVEDAREAAVAADLSWLLHEGHVIDYARRGLEAARRPKPPAPKPPSKKREPAKPSEPEAAAPIAPPEPEAIIPDTPADPDPHPADL